MWCCSLRGWPCVQTQNLRNLAANHAKEMQQRRKDQLNADNERRNKKLAKIAIEHRVGAWVMIRVHSGDRSSLGKALLRMLVVEYHEVTGFYRLAHEHGVLERMVLSNQIFKNSNSQAQISSNLSKSHQITSNPNKSYQISSHLITFHQILSNLITCHQFTSNLNNFHEIYSIHIKYNQF